eukprot:3723797-Rhodomonas_salina.2
MLAAIVDARRPCTRSPPLYTLTAIVHAHRHCTRSPPMHGQVLWRMGEVNASVLTAPPAMASACWWACRSLIPPPPSPPLLPSVPPGREGSRSCRVLLLAVCAVNAGACCAKGGAEKAERVTGSVCTQRRSAGTSATGMDRQRGEDRARRARREAEEGRRPGKRGGGGVVGV